VRADEIEIEAPCDEDWDGMRPEAGGRRRWCEHCERQVHDLSKMSEPAARAFLREHAGQACVAFFEDETGELVFAPEPKLVPLERVARRPRLVEAAKLASAASVAALLGACTPHGHDNRALRLDDDAEPTSVSAPNTVIPTATAEPPARAVEPGAPPIAEHPCESPPARRPRDLPIKGKPRRTMGVMIRTTNDPLGDL
jgi:hypothetical protein